jgi:hypothetical protein
MPVQNVSLKNTNRQTHLLPRHIATVLLIGAILFYITATAETLPFRDAHLLP